MLRLELIGISKQYPAVKANDNVNLQVLPGEIHAVLGENGAGKSTMMKMIYGAVRPDEGEILWNGERVDIKNPQQARALGISMVFQHFNLFPHLSIIENLMLGPIWVRKVPKKEAEETAMYYLEKVQIAEQARKYPGQLSGGQEQRVGIARAIVTDPSLLLCDEPTGDLDRKSGDEVLDLLAALNEQGKTVIMVTHDPHAAERAPRLLRLEDGRLAGS